MFDLSDFYLYIIIFLVLLLVVILYFCIKFALIIIKMQDTIENSLDVIDEKYATISEILEIPVFFDSPEVKRVLAALKDVRDSLLYVANELTSNNLEEDTQKNEDN